GCVQGGQRADEGAEQDAHSPGPGDVAEDAAVADDVVGDVLGGQVGAVLVEDALDVLAGNPLVRLELGLIGHVGTPYLGEGPALALLGRVRRSRSAGRAEEQVVRQSTLCSGSCGVKHLSWRT